MFSRCANTKGARKGHLCVFSCVSAARRCVWTSFHRTSSCKQKVAPLNASAGVLAGAMSFHILSHSPQCGRCAASSSLCRILWEPQVRSVRVLMCLFSKLSCAEYEDSERKAPLYSPPTWLFTVGASTRHSAQPLALLAQLILIIHQPDVKVGQITCVQGRVGAQLPVSRVGLFLYPNVWNSCVH